MDASPCPESPAPHVTPPPRRHARARAGTPRSRNRVSGNSRAYSPKLSSLRAAMARTDVRYRSAPAGAASAPAPAAGHWVVPDITGADDESTLAARAAVCFFNCAPRTRARARRPHAAPHRCTAAHQAAARGEYVEPAVRAQHGREERRHAYEPFRTISGPQKRAHTHDATNTTHTRAHAPGYITFAGKRQS